jgi:hypothetical protein
VAAPGPPPRTRTSVSTAIRFPGSAATSRTPRRAPRRCAQPWTALRRPPPAGSAAKCEGATMASKGRDLAAASAAPGPAITDGCRQWRRSPQRHSG